MLVGCTTRRIYFQDNVYIEVPDVCKRFINTSNELSALFDCTALQLAVDNFIVKSCKNSFAKVCFTAFQDNPPFSCSRQVQDSYSSIIANSLSNGGAAASIAVLMLVFYFRYQNPHGVEHREIIRQRKLARESKRTTEAENTLRKRRDQKEQERRYSLTLNAAIYPLQEERDGQNSEDANEFGPENDVENAGGTRNDLDV